jgi:Transposase zinc-ribbon domain
VHFGVLVFPPLRGRRGSDGKGFLAFVADVPCFSKFLDGCGDKLSRCAVRYGAQPLELPPVRISAENRYSADRSTHFRRERTAIAASGRGCHRGQLLEQPAVLWN